MRYVFLIVIICSFIFLFGCSEKESPTYVNVGTLISIDVIPTSFNESIKCKIETTKGIYIIWGTISGEKGALVRKSSDGYLFIENNHRGNRIL